MAPATHHLLDPNTVGIQPTLATTDLNGNYLFTDVPAGSYQVDVVSGVPAGLVASPGATDPKAVTLTAGQSYRTPTSATQPRRARL